MRVGEDLGQARKNGGEEDGELARSQERHGAHELNSPLLGPPLLLVKSLEQRRQDELDGVSAQLAHDGLGGVLRRLPDLPRRIAEACEEDGERLGDVRLKESAEDGRQNLVTEDGTLPRLDALLVLGVVP